MLPRVLRVLRVVAVVCSVLMLLATTGGYLVYRHLNNNINHIDVAGLKTHHSKTVNYLIIGSDNRQVPGGAAFGSHQMENLSDTVILAHLAGDGKSARLISFPRDMLVHIPSCKRWTGSKGVSAPRTDKFNVAYSLGGPECTIKTVEQISGFAIDDYIVVSLPGFVQISNALGGVEVCVPNAVNDKQSSIFLPAGRYKVKGVQALGFVRERDQLGGSRIRRQQEFLASAIKSATRTGLLANPPKLYHLLDVTTKAITTGHLNLDGLRKLAQRFRDIKPGNVTFYTVPTLPERRQHLPGYGNPRGVFVDPEDVPAAQRLFTSVKAGSPVPAPTPSATGSVHLIVPASSVPVRVLNGTGAKGAASKAADDLRAAGFDVVGTGDADATTYTQTIVRYGAQRVESSQTLNAAVPGSVRQYDAGLGNVVELIIGAGYNGAHSVTVGSPTPQPSASASPAPVKGFTAEEDVCAANKGNTSGPA
jgi:LCP family protein required for cell wall assembly